MQATKSLFSGLVWKRRFRLTPSQKQRLRNRLRNVDSVISTLVASGVDFAALTAAKRTPTEAELTPFQKYFVSSKRYKNGFKPLHWVPKWTRVPHPRKWSQEFLHVAPNTSNISPKLKNNLKV